MAEEARKEEIYFERKEDVDKLFERAEGLPDYSKMPDAPLGEDWVPEKGHWPKGYKVATFPKAPKSVWWLLGPSAIVLGFSMGSGESLFWPNITAKFGWSLWWGFWVGACTQWILNMELMRSAMVTGETWFRWMARLHPIWPWVFFIFGFLHLVWPGWVASGAKFLGYVIYGLDFEKAAANWPYIGAALMFLIWLICVGGPWIYRAVEWAEIALIFFAYALLFVILFGAHPWHGFAGWYEQFAWVGRFNWDVIIPPGTPPEEAAKIRHDFLLTLLGGLAYAGAGGYGNITYSLYAREKGFGMAAWSGRVKNPIFVMWGKEKFEEVPDFGFVARPEKAELEKFRAWWRVASIEHFITFSVLLIVGAFIMSGIARAYAEGTKLGAVDMWLKEAVPAMQEELGRWIGYLFGICEFFILFTTQLGVVDIFVRNSTDIVYEMLGRWRGWRIDWIYFILLTIFIIWGIGIILAQVKKPWLLLVLGANIAGIMMWPYGLTTIIANTKLLPKHFQPGWLKMVGMWWATGFYGYFSVLVIIDNIEKNVLKRPLGAGGEAVLWGIYVISIIIMIVLSSMYKIRKSRAG